MNKARPSARSRRILERQLRKSGVGRLTSGGSGDPENSVASGGERFDSEAFDAFLDMVESTYEEFERHRRLTEHSTRLASDELNTTMSSLAANERLFRSLARCSPNGILYTDSAGRCLYANRRAAEICGCQPGELEAHGWFGFIPRDDQADFEKLARDQLLTEDGDCVIEHRLRRPDGEIIWVSTSIAAVDQAAVDDSNAVGWVANIEDITQRKLYERELSRLARNDSLTGLDNRYSLTQRLQQLCADAGADRTLAVAVIDLDRFKLVNDTFGHEAGDTLLIAIAEQLRAVAGDGDIVARLGGDEFAVAKVLDPDETPESMGAALSRAIHGPVDCLGRRVHVGGSVGVAVATSSRITPDELLRDADTAMYRAKRTRSLTYQVFNETFRADVTNRFLMESELRDAINDGDICLAYQPIADALTHKIISVEALARWNNPRLGAVPPIEFISVAEDLGLISELGEHLLDQACRQVSTWRKSSPALRQLTLSFNTSALQLSDPEFPKVVRRVLARNELPAAALTIEITEGAIIADFERSLAVLDDLRNLGVSVAIDDFGTGYSALSYLERLPVDYLKIDRSFVQAMGDDLDHETSNRLTETIIELAHRFGLTPVAEGVETDFQRRKLRRAGCDLIQGHLFATAMAPDDPELNAILAGTPIEAFDPQALRRSISSP